MRVAQALTKQRPVLLISHPEACAGQETVVAVPIRTVPPPFVCHGLVKLSTLQDPGTLTGYIRCDLPIFYRRSDLSKKVIHQFTVPGDIEKIEAALRDAFGL